MLASRDGHDSKAVMLYTAYQVANGEVDKTLAFIKVLRFHIIMSISDCKLIKEKKRGYTVLITN